MVGGLEVALVAAGVVTMGAGALLAVRGLNVAHVRFMAAWCLIFGFSQVLWAVYLPFPLGRLLEMLLRASILGVAISYPGPGLRPRHRWVIGWLFLFAAGIGLVLSGVGGLEPGGITRALGRTLTVSARVGVPLYLGWRALRTRSALARDQLVWIVMPLTFWSIHHSVLLFDEVGLWAEGGGTPGAYHLIQLAGFAVTVAAALVLGIRSFRLPADKARPAQTFAFAVPPFIAISFIQFAAPAPQEWLLHALVDTLNALLLFYGITRYGMIDLRLRLRWGIRHGTVAAVFVAGFFLVSESAATFLNQASGSPYVGIVGASLLIFALAPLQRLADHVSTRAVPLQGGTEAYLQYRRLHIYRAALEATLADRHVDAWETAALRALRQELNVSPEEHRLLEGELKAAAPVPATAG